MSHFLRFAIFLALLSIVAGCNKRPQRKIECVDGGARLQKILQEHTTLDSTAPADDSTSD